MQGHAVADVVVVKPHLDELALLDDDVRAGRLAVEGETLDLTAGEREGAFLGRQVDDDVGRLLRPLDQGGDAGAEILAVRMR